jgi:hypothetical protein
MSTPPLEHFRRTVALEVLTIEHAVSAISRALTRLRMGFEEMSNIDTPHLALGPELDDEVA